MIEWLLLNNLLKVLLFQWFQFMPCIVAQMIVRNKNFYDILINLIRKLGEKETVVKLGDSNGHAGNNREEYQDHHGGYCYEVLNKEDV